MTPVSYWIVSKHLSQVNQTFVHLIHTELSILPRSQLLTLNRDVRCLLPCTAFKPYGSSSKARIISPVRLPLLSTSLVCYAFSLSPSLFPLPYIEHSLVTCFFLNMF